MAFGSALRPSGGVDGSKAEGGISRKETVRLLSGFSKPPPPFTRLMPSCGTRPIREPGGKTRSLADAAPARPRVTSSAVRVDRSVVGPVRIRSSGSAFGPFDEGQVLNGQRVGKGLARGRQGPNACFSLNRLCKIMKVRSRNREQILATGCGSLISPTTLSVGAIFGGRTGS